MYKTYFQKSLRFFTFLNTNFLLQSEMRCGIMNFVTMTLYHVPCFCRSARHRVPPRCFFFFIKICYSKNDKGLHPKAPSIKRLEIFVLALESFISLNL